MVLLAYLTCILPSSFRPSTECCEGGPRLACCLALHGGPDRVQDMLTPGLIHKV